MVLPLLKFGILAVRTISKPVANSLKSYAVDHPVWRSACGSAGQVWHRVTTRVNVRLMGHKVSKIKDLPEAEAVTRGADVFGEMFVYCVSAGGIMVELWRSQRDNKQKAIEKAQRHAEKERFWSHQLDQIEDQVIQLQKDNSELRRLVEDLQRKNEEVANKKWSWLGM